MQGDVDLKLLHLCNRTQLGGREGGGVGEPSENPGSVSPLEHTRGEVEVRSSWCCGAPASPTTCHAHPSGHLGVSAQAGNCLSFLLFLSLFLSGTPSAPDLSPYPASRVSPVPSDWPQPPVTPQSPRAPALTFPHAGGSCFPRSASPCSPTSHSCTRLREPARNKSPVATRTVYLPILPGPPGGSGEKSALRGLETQLPGNHAQSRLPVIFGFQAPHLPPTDSSPTGRNIETGRQARVSVSSFSRRLWKVQPHPYSLDKHSPCQVHTLP